MAAVASLEDWYHFVHDKMPLETSRTFKLKNITELANYLSGDLKDACITNHKLFFEALGIDYIRLAYEIYERELTGLAHELTETTCDKLKPVVFKADANNDYVNDTMAVGTGLFELYLALQHFAK